MNTKNPNANILILGTDAYGLMTFYAYRNSNSHHVIGFMEVNVREGITLEGLNVYRVEWVTPEFVKHKSIDAIVIAIQYMDTVKLLELTKTLLKLDIPLKIIPPVTQILDGFIDVNQIKDLNIDDLMLRVPKMEVSAMLLEAYEHQTILITGAAGSIGSALANMLCRCNFKQLILIDSSESALFEAQQELLQKGVKNFKAVVADIRDYQRMDQLFDLYKPKVVFHAAAYKHVPLMEEHPYEAVNANVVGTKHIADLSVKHSVYKFIFISTDKAVNPTNVMGASKRIAELYLKSLKDKGQTKFIMTRFGNVLGSNGSVIPLFKKQIAAGGPVGVTHREIKRYFMAIPEACHLILESGAMGNGGELYAFDMGKPIRIHDLAMLMIRLSGRRFPEDIDIRITGLRPGEKLMEELLASDEQSKTTYHGKIRVAQSSALAPDNLQEKILDLCHKVSRVQNLELVAMIKAIVPEYISNNSTFGVLDDQKKNL